MISVGDLVRNTDEFSGFFKNTFTVKEIILDSLFDNLCYCYRKRTTQIFREHCLEKVDSPPRFAVGTVVTPKKSYSFPFYNIKFGVVEASNKIGSLVRIWNAYGNQIHMVEYISNRNLRKA